MTEYDDNFGRVKKIADDMGLILNPNEKRVHRVVSKMTHHFVTMGEYVCPCKQTTEHPVKGQEILCPCDELEDEIKRDGKCHCRLFYSPNHPSAKKGNPAIVERTLDQYPVVC